MEIKNELKVELAGVCSIRAKYVAERPWEVKCDIALPCATQNELKG
jgi:glutamate dehydrogenase (NADP+)